MLTPRSWRTGRPRAAPPTRAPCLEGRPALADSSRPPAPRGRIVTPLPGAPPPPGRACAVGISPTARARRARPWPIAGATPWGRYTTTSTKAIPDEEQPDERQVAAEEGGHVVDADRAEDRPDQGPAPAEGGPHDELGAEHEVPVGVGGDAAEEHVEGAGEGRDGAARRHEPDLQARRPEAQVPAALLVLADGDQDPSGIARHEHVGGEGDEEEEPPEIQYHSATEKRGTGIGRPLLDPV